MAIIVAGLIMAVIARRPSGVKGNEAIPLNLALPWLRSSSRVFP
jgi:hypothetical protein